ncbi:cell wall protein IFF6-like [Portunus trituberculatus]|uniref:cell wall protein IFF6-like n=1 Tax=Portunus trituberculatus TaxID=210409 RepID=UPI001E1D04A4|nr:cell wall protein IFF6-like [Portunus trituberculatus]
MRCWAAFLVVLVAGFHFVPSMGQTYGSGSASGSGTGSGSASGSAFVSGQTGTSGTAGSGSASGGQGAGQFSNGGTGSGFAGSAGAGRTVGAGFGAGTGAAGRGVAGFPGFVGTAGTAGQGGAGAFQRGTSVIQQQPTPTVTQTVTIDRFTTLTDIVFQSYGVTLTQFVVETATRPVQQVVVTPVNDQVAITTTVLHRPEYITLTETKSDFRLAVRTSVSHVTLTHTAYNIMHVPFTITATETVHLTSPVVRTVISTQRQVVTDYRTIVNTVYARGGYH